MCRKINAELNSGTPSKCRQFLNPFRSKTTMSENKSSQENATNAQQRSKDRSRPRPDVLLEGAPEQPVTMAPDMIAKSAAKPGPIVELAPTRPPTIGIKPGPIVEIAPEIAPSSRAAGIQAASVGQPRKLGIGIGETIVEVAPETIVEVAPELRPRPKPTTASGRKAIAEMAPELRS